MYSEKYKNIEIQVHFNKESKKFYATSSIGFNSSNTSGENSCMGYNTPVEAVKDVKDKILVFLETSPKTYKELAEEITKTLIWTGYEDCYADEDVIKILVENFLKTKQ